MTDSSESPARNRFVHYHSAYPSQPLTGSDLHIWCASLNGSQEDLPCYLSLLSPDEKVRAKRFYFEKDRNRFITGRGLLRILLGSYLGLEPSAIQFTYGIHGKPALTSRFNGKVLEFNLSHSKGKAVYVFNWDQPVGIDIEYGHPLKNMDDFALQFFTPNECKFIHSLSKDRKQESFLKIWTCKEAFLKANGSGLTTPINQVEVSLTTEGTATLTSIGGDREQAARWRLKLFTPIAGYQASLAIEGHHGKIILQQLNNHVMR
jgi:4'-phosphopantetheinyl transferase